MFAFLNNMKPPILFIRIFRFEYWPTYIIYFPVVFYWTYLALRSRSLTFFTAVNPGFKKVGFLRESKIDILKKIPKKYLPKTAFVSKADGLNDVRKYLKQQKITFPFICKPNIGERGLHVEIIKNYDNLNNYLLAHEEDFLIQEYIPYEIELGIFFYQLPDRTELGISSIVEKEFLHVIGDGKSTIETLMQHTRRAKMQKKRMANIFKNKLDYIPKNGEKFVLEPIGNHCRGTMFLDANHLNDPRLLDTFSNIAKNIDGFNFGRFDIRTSSINDLYEGKAFKMGMVFPVSTHNYEIRNWLAAAGIHPGMYTANNIQGQIDADVLLSVTQ